VPDNMTPATQEVLISDNPGEAEILSKTKSGEGACPDCGCSLSYGEGCVKCTVCGYSKCS